MRPDRIASYRQKLRRRLDNFEFGALLQGVSTLEEEPTTSTDERPPAEGEFLGFIPALDPDSLDIPVVEVAAQSVEVALEDTRESEEPLLQTALPLDESAIRVQVPGQGSLARDRLQIAMEELSCRLFQETSRLGACLRAEDYGAAGARLARLNQLLEVVHTVDPSGDLSRSFGLPGSPPEGRGWPSPVWSAVEFAESPLSGLLPAESTEESVRQLLYAAWGITSRETA